MNVGEALMKGFVGFGSEESKEGSDNIPVRNNISDDPFPPDDWTMAELFEKE